MEKSNCRKWGPIRELRPRSPKMASSRSWQSDCRHRERAGVPTAGVQLTAKALMIQETTAGIVLVVDDWANNVGPAKEFTGSVEIVVEVVVQVERLAGLDSNDSIQAPAVANKFIIGLLVRRETRR